MTGRKIKTHTTVVLRFSNAFARPFSLFIGGFTLLNLIGELLHPGFNANNWWIDFRPLNIPLTLAILAAASVTLIAYSLTGALPTRLRSVMLFLIAAMLVAAACNTINFYRLLAAEKITSACTLPFSLFISAALALVLINTASNKSSSAAGRRQCPKVVLVATLIACGFAFPLGQMFCFGKTDYSRKADAVVVFGARVYADGRCSDALADRVRTACRLYHAGFADTLIFSGGPGDGRIHETEAMRNLAVKLRVPHNAVLLDKAGLNTLATVKSTCAIFDNRRIGRVLAVSHFYHLPRIKMAYQRNRREVYTVPAKETYLLTEMPTYICREVAAFWLYYIRPLTS